MQTLLFPVYRRIRCKIEIPESRKNMGTTIMSHPNSDAYVRIFKTPPMLRHSAVRGPINRAHTGSGSILCCLTGLGSLPHHDWLIRQSRDQPRSHLLIMKAYRR